jgi:hypothetical protein
MRVRQDKFILTDTASLQLHLAEQCQSDDCVDFFAAYLPRADSEIEPEFLCPSGVRAAIRRREIVVLLDEGQVVGAVRFYLQRRRPIISLYQFAIAPPYRSRGLFPAMLEPLRDRVILTRFPASAVVNRYLKKAGWYFERQFNGRSFWSLPSCPIANCILDGAIAIRHTLALSRYRLDQRAAESSLPANRE